MGSHIGCQETTAEAANKRQTTGSASGNRGRINHQSSPRIKQKQGSPRFDQNEFHTASESSGRIPELKTTAAVSSSTSGTPTGPQTSSLLVSQHPLLCSLLSSPSPQQLVVTPRRQQSQEVGV